LGRRRDCTVQKLIKNLSVFFRSTHLRIGLPIGLKPEGKRLLERPRHRWVDNIKMDLGEIGWNGVDWIDMAQNRDQWRALENMVLNLRVS
jgi:hypothetical protein